MGDESEIKPIKPQKLSRGKPGIEAMEASMESSSTAVGESETKPIKPQKLTRGKRGIKAMKASMESSSTDVGESETKPIKPQQLSRGRGYGIKDLASLKQRSLGLKNDSSGA